MGKYVTLNSAAELEKVVADNTYVLLDFWATWCPPCKMIAPIFEKLANEHSSEKGFVFGKVDVDEQQEISKKYNIKAMPTFILLHNGEVKKTIQGANPPAIKAVVLEAVEGLKKVQDKKAEEKTTGDKKVDAEAVKKDEETVSGSYTVSKNANWRTELR